MAVLFMPQLISNFVVKISDDGDYAGLILGITFVMKIAPAETVL